jgi:uncharacterized protein YdhG (YjbR/CyaY superfamily)
MNEATTVDENLKKLPDDEKEELQRIRTIIFQTIPDVKERIAYKICVFSLNKDLVGFASQKNHLSFYSMSPQQVKKMKNDLKGLKLSGATIHFSPKKPLPKDLLQKILKARKKEITHSLS